MRSDISTILREWSYSPKQVSARRVTANDGKTKIQLRLPLGVLQMELDGRPDGTRVGEADGACTFESWLHYYKQRLLLHQKREAQENPFALERSDCARLLREGLQYYHRYLSFWHLEMYDKCARDALRNLRLFAFVRLHAAYVQDVLTFDQWRPYVTLMYTRSVAVPLLAQGERGRALEAIDRGIEAIVKFLKQYGQLRRSNNVEELVSLKQWRADLGAEPASSNPEPLRRRDVRLKLELRSAIDRQHFEEAARLRDKIARLGS